MSNEVNVTLCMDYTAVSLTMMRVDLAVCLVEVKFYYSKCTFTQSTQRHMVDLSRLSIALVSLLKSKIFTCDSKVKKAGLSQRETTLFSAVS